MTIGVAQQTKPQSAPARRSRALALAAGLSLALAACAVPNGAGHGTSGTALELDGPADLLFHGGPIISVAGPAPGLLDPAVTTYEVLALRGARIAYVGAADGAAGFIGPDTRMVDLAGRTLLPGLGDSHLHLLGFGRLLRDVDVVDTRSYAEVIERVRRRAAETPAGQWVRGRGWDQNDWDDKRFPHHAELSAAVPDHPVVIARIDGHALLANAAALTIAGVDASTQAPPGGRIERDADGNPTGVLVDNAMSLVYRAVPDDGREQDRDAARRAIAALHRYGITQIHDAGVSGDDVELFRELALQGKFDLRSHVMIRAGDPVLARTDDDLPTNDLTGQGLIAVQSIKAMADGALGSRGAMLIDEYSDDPGNHGLAVMDAEQIRSVADFALRDGWQVCVHAIGDRANRDVLDAFEGAFAADERGGAELEGRCHLGHDHGVPSRAEGRRRFRIEHAQVLHPDDIPRFAELGVAASMQALHQTSDMPWAEDRVGPLRVRGAYAWHSLLRAGAVLTGGSDCPVERPDPFAALRAYVTRQDAEQTPPGGWYPEQTVSRGLALQQITSAPAWAAFDRCRLGQLGRGMKADLVVLDGNPLDVPADSLDDLQVELTLFDGRVVYEREPGALAPTLPATGPTGPTGPHAARTDAAATRAGHEARLR